MDNALCCACSSYVTAMTGGTQPMTYWLRSHFCCDREIPNNCDVIIYLIHHHSNAKIGHSYYYFIRNEPTPIGGNCNKTLTIEHIGINLRITNILKPTGSSTALLTSSSLQLRERCHSQYIFSQFRPTS